MSVSTKVPTQEKKRLKKRWFAYFGANTLALSILLHVVFGVAATYLIVEHFVPKHINFHATEPPTAHTEVEHQEQMAKRNNVESAPPDIKRIVTTDVSAITLPDPPEIPTTDDANPTPMAGLDGVMGSGLAGGGGVGGGGGGLGGGGGGSPVYGAPDGDGFAGTFYDLKQTPDHQPTAIAETAYERSVSEDQDDPDWAQSAPTLACSRLLSSFVKTWDMSMLDGYYKSDQTLHSTQIVIPPSPSPDGPKAFHVDGTVRARRWIIVYEAKIVPPDSAKYRFIGLGDDFMVVRINGNNVLDAGWDGAELDPSARTNEDVGMGPEGAPLRCGNWVYMSTNDTIDMQVLIGEGPGTLSGFLLMVQKEGDNSPKGDYPVFQLADGHIPDIPGFNFSKKKLLFNVAQ